MTEQQCRVEETICGPMTVDKRFWQCETTYGLILLFVDRFVRLSPGLVHAVWKKNYLRDFSNMKKLHFCKLQLYLLITGLALEA